MGRKVFRELVSEEKARSIFYEHLPKYNYKVEELPLVDAIGRVIAEDVFSTINVPPFNRASMDGFAVRAADTVDAAENNSISLNVIGEIKAGYVFDGVVGSGQCIEISTGAPMPKGADAVVMVEYTSRTDSEVSITQAVTPNENTMAAGADIQLGERVIPIHKILTSRELAILSAIGRTKVKVVQKPRIGVFSSGDEIVPPGSDLLPGKLFDINSTAIITSIIENGGHPEFLGIIKDVREDIFTQLQNALVDYDLVIISGGTSAGMGDMLYEVIDELGEPGLLVHGVKVKPGKPTILAVCDSKPIIGLPGYPASALSIHQLFVLPLIRLWAKLPPLETTSTISATVQQRIRSAEGRYEFKPMYLFKGIENWVAYPVPGGSGAITSVGLADGFLQIPANTHFIPAGSEVKIHLISDRIKPPTIQIIGSYDIALAKLQALFEEKFPQFPVRLVGVSSTAGVSAIRRGEAHIAGIHLLNPEKGYNIWVPENSDSVVIPGYYRMQGLIVAKGNPKQIFGLNDLLREDVTFMNRNSGSGTRVLLDSMLDKMGVDKTQIKGYNNTVRSDIAAAESVKSGFADVSIGVELTAREENLDFVELREEEFDLLLNSKFLNQEYIKQFIDLLHSDEFKSLISQLAGYRVKEKQEE